MKDYTVVNPVFSDKISIVEEDASSDSVRVHSYLQVVSAGKLYLSIGFLYSSPTSSI